MTTYRYLDHPHPEPSEQVHVRVQLDHESGAGECLRAHPLGSDLYRILNIPLFSAEIGMDDIVLALTLDDEPEFVEVVARRSHVRYSFELPDLALIPGLSHTAARLGVAVECGVGIPLDEDLDVVHDHASRDHAAGVMFVANLPDRTNASQFQAFLETHAVWFECVDIVGATAAGRAREDVSTNGGDR